MPTNLWLMKLGRNALRPETSKLPPDCALARAKDSQSMMQYEPSPRDSTCVDTTIHTQATVQRTELT